jgi:protease-4
VAWLVRERKVDSGLRVRDWDLRSRFRDLPFLHVAAIRVLDAAGLTSLAERLGSAGALQTIEKLNLDGLLALWHPSVGN